MYCVLVNLRVFSRPTPRQALATTLQDSSRITNGQLASSLGPAITRPRIHECSVYLKTSVGLETWNNMDAAGSTRSLECRYLLVDRHLAHRKSPLLALGCHRRTKIVITRDYEQTKRSQWLIGMTNPEIIDSNHGRVQHSKVGEHHEMEDQQYYIWISRIQTKRSHRAR